MKKFLAVAFALIFLITGCGSDDKKVEKTSTDVKKIEIPAVDEKVAFQNFKSKILQGCQAVDNHWDTLWKTTITNFFNGQIDEKTAFQTLKQLEQNLINDEMIFYNAYNEVDSNLNPEIQNSMNQIRENFQEWTQRRRKSSENFRNILVTSNINEENINKITEMIKNSDTYVLSANAKMIELENRINSK